MTHYPPHIKPLPNTTVLLVHYYDDETEPAVSTGSVGDDGEWTWDHLAYRDDGLSITFWMPLPLIPERP